MFEPQLHFNLIFVSALTTDCKFIMNFFLDYFIIQNLSTKETIGRGEKRGILYILSTSKVNSTSLTDSL